MNLWKEHVEYLKDNPEGYWFKRKLYGWGWTPARPQGWLVLVIFVVLIILNFYRLDVGSESVTGDVLVDFLAQTGVLVFVLLLICYRKGEPPKWQWGRGKDEDKLI